MRVCKTELKLQEEIVMKLLKRMAVLTLVVLALGGCTESSISNEAPVAAGNEEVDPGKFTDDDDVVIPRDQNFLIEEDPEEQPMYDWDQVRNDLSDLLSEKDSYPETKSVDFTADEENLTISLVWNVGNGISDGVAMEYAAAMVKVFNDLVAVQTTDIEEATADSFGGLWNTFALNVKVVKEDGTAVIDKSYKAGDKIDLVPAVVEEEAGPEEVEENVPKKA